MYVQRLERHQHQQSVRVVVQLGVKVSRFWVEESHGGLTANVLLVLVDRSVVQSGDGSVRRELSIISMCVLYIHMNITYETS